MAAEFAVVATDRSRLESLAAEGRRGARTAMLVHRRLSYHLSAAQLGLTVSSLVLGFVAEPTLARLMEPALQGLVSERTARGLSVALALAIATVLSMVVGELIPKNLVLARPEQSALRLAGPLRVCALVMRPFIVVANAFADRLVRMLGVEPQEELASVRSVEDLAVLLRAGATEGPEPSDYSVLVERSLRFADKTAADALVARVHVHSLPSEATLAELVAWSVETGHSRCPVVGEDLDDVIGVVHVKDTYSVPRDAWGTTSVTQVMTEPLAVPETRELEHLFGELRVANSHLAVVVDEYGGTAGIITLEDVLEEIVGDIDDEYDAPVTLVRAELSSGSWLLAGTLHPDEVEEACGFVVPDGEYETVAGFVLDQLGRVPHPGDGLTYDGWQVRVVEMDGLRVARVRLTPPDEPPVPDGEGSS